MPNVKNVPHFPKPKSSTICSDPCSSILVKKADELVREQATSKSKDSNTLPLAPLHLIPRIWFLAYHLIRAHTLSQSQKVPWTFVISLHLRFDSAALKATETLHLTFTKAVQGYGTS